MSASTITPGKKRNDSRRSGGQWWRHLLALVAVFWALFPIVFVVSAAFNPAGTLSTSRLIPRSFSLQNFETLFNSPEWPFLRWYGNSLYVAGVGAVLTLLIGAMSAYVFSRMRFKGRRVGLMALLLIQMFPALLAFVAVYITFDRIGQVVPLLGLNSTTGLMLAYLGGSMGANVWLLKGYFDTVPKALDEAATIDGASHVRIFFTIIIPLVVPILVTVFMIVFVGLFSEFMLASIFLRDANAQTLGVGLWALQSADKNRFFGQFAAGAVLASLPVTIIYMSLQKQLIGGLTSGSVK
ncbi:sugar ABC transporter permease [Tessaracoccus caeni]|uniref:sugar ABC transporter permease n=1 Tax=Tessaracoccus caeni TaxID=3031239 RepID=UPI0023DAB66D|nr:sugar ABC transporter permease [Tessaracoccus caeni]MDF1487308.1 sugar ABC transporter permease [Tessaracoccus caeni]